MPYVRRDADGKIVALLKESDEGAQEFIAPHQPEVRVFLGEDPEGEFFRSLDLDFVRVLEDLINALIERGVLQFTDLPDEAQQKLRMRERFRDRPVAGALDILGERR